MQTKISTSTATWIATALLHTENKDRDSFRCNEIIQRIRDEDLVQTSNSTILVNVTSHSVANTRSIRSSQKNSTEYLEAGTDSTKM